MSRRFSEIEIEANINNVIAQVIKSEIGEVVYREQQKALKSLNKKLRNYEDKVYLRVLKALGKRLYESKRFKILVKEIKENENA